MRTVVQGVEFLVHFFGGFWLFPRLRFTLRPHQQFEVCHFTFLSKISPYDDKNAILLAAPLHLGSSQRIQCLMAL
jgi:hypothetical protein